MKANLSLYNAILNIWMAAVHPSRQISVTSLGWITFNCQLFSCLALKTIPYWCEIVVTFCPRSVEVHVSIRCIESDVARTFKSNCRGKTLEFLKLFRVGYFKERGVKTLTNPSRHKEYERIISQEMWPASTEICISIWFVDCLANWYLRRAFLCCLFAQIVNVTLWGLAISVSRHHTEKADVFDISFCAPILILGSGFIVWTITSLFLSGRFFPMKHSSPHFLLKTQSFYGLTLNGTHKNLNQPRMVFSNWMRSHRVVWSVSDRTSVCRHTYLASSANESLWALTLECPKYINTCAAILAWIAFTACTFVDVWGKKKTSTRFDLFRLVC